MRSLSIFKHAYENYRENWDNHDRIARINRAGRVLSRGVNRYLKRNGYFRHERVMRVAMHVYSWSHIMNRD